MSKVRQFERFERECSLFDIEIDGVLVWERIRFGTLREIQEQTGSGQAHTSIKLDTNDVWKGFKLWIRNFSCRNPYLAPKSDVLFVGHPRRKKKSDGFWWDLYSDPIHAHSSLDSIHFEMPYLLGHRSPAKTESLRYLEFIHYSGTIQRKLGLHDITLTPDAIARLEQVESEIKRRFDADIHLTSQVRRLLRNRRCRLWMYERLLHRVDPEVVVVVVSYGKETFIEACKNLDIPVVELQHGVINPQHLGYAYSDNRTKETFPDYLLVWGDHWQEAVEYPIPDERVIPVGYPYLEQSVEQYEDVVSRDQILFISQGTIGKQLSKFALEVHDHPEINHDIVYKLHPGEYHRWQETYPWLLDADFEVVYSSEPPLYELFAESSVQIGVHSTAVYEGLTFDLETYVYACSETDGLEPLIKEGSALPISSADDLAASIGTEKNSFESEFYFGLNATETMCEVLERLADQGTQYRQQRC